VVPLRSSSCLSPDPVIPGLFLPRSRPCLLDKAAEGGLEPAPASRFRGADPHQLNSCAPPWPFGRLLCSWHTIVGYPETGRARPVPVSTGAMFAIRGDPPPERDRELAGGFETSVPGEVEADPPDFPLRVSPPVLPHGRGVTRVAITAAGSRFIAPALGTGKPSVEKASHSWFHGVSVLFRRILRTLSS